MMVGQGVLVRGYKVVRAQRDAVGHGHAQVALHTHGVPSGAQAELAGEQLVQ